MPGYVKSISVPLDADHLNQLKLNALEPYATEIISIKITNLGAKLFNNMVRPFVRLHIVDRLTGEYFHRPGSTVPSTFHSTATFSMKDNIILPNWSNEYVDVAYKELLKTTALILFEVLDEKPTLRSTHVEQHNKKKPFKRIGWGFLSPVALHSSSSEPAKEVTERLHVGLCHDWIVSASAAGTTTDTDPAPESTAERSEGETKSPGTSARRRSSVRQAASIATVIPHPVTIQLYQYQKEDMACKYQRWIESPQQFTHYSNEIVRSGEQGSGLEAGGIPSVYWQWRRAQYQAFEPSNTCLYVSIGPCLPPMNGDNGINATTDPAIPGGVDGVSLGKQITADNIAQSQVQKWKRMRTAILKRSRAPKEPCALPNRLYSRLDVGEEGAMVVAFSHCGHVLAVCAPNGPSISPLYGASEGIVSDPVHDTYNIQFYDMDNQAKELCRITLAHHGVIYSCVWSPSDKELLTASADGTVKLWTVDRLLLMHQSHQRKFRRASMGTPQQPIVEDVSTATAPGPGMGGEDGAGATVGTLDLLCVLTHTPPIYVYSAIFTDIKGAHGIPKIVTGGHDGWIRVWDKDVQEGTLTLGTGESSQEEPLQSPHHGKITDLLLEPRTRFLISSDSEGLILVWKQHTAKTTGHTGPWYTVLRKLRTELSGSPITIVTGLSLVPTVMTSMLDTGASASSSSLPMLLVCSPPKTLQSFSLSSYKPTTPYTGMEASTAVLSRPAVSPDGRYIVSSHGTEQRSHVLKVWDSRSGRCVSESWLSQWTTKYPLRSMSWHPTQHMLAIASLGPGATVTVLYAEKEHTHSLAKRLVPSFFASSPVGRKHGESYDNTSDAGSVASVRFQGTGGMNRPLPTIAESPVLKAKGPSMSSRLFGSVQDSDKGSETASQTGGTTTRSDRVLEILNRLKEKKRAAGLSA